MATTSHENGPEGVRYSYEDDLVTATDIETGVAGCGETRSEALAELADALALHEGDGELITDEDGYLREIGIAAVDETSEQTPPWLE